MKAYELTYIISPEISSEEAETTAKEIDSGIQAGEGVVVKSEKPQAKTLSYAIKGRASGFVGSIEFQMEPENLGQLQEKLQKDGKIIRHIVIIKEPVRVRKERRTRTPMQSTSETKPETKTEESSKLKVELKDIEQKLDEILGQ